MLLILSHRSAAEIIYDDDVDSEDEDSEAEDSVAEDSEAEDSGAECSEAGGDETKKDTRGDTHRFKVVGTSKDNSQPRSEPRPKRLHRITGFLDWMRYLRI